MSDELDVRRRRALYRAGHRGTKELDILLSKFATSRVPSMSETELGEFESLLELPDPSLQRWLVTILPVSGDDTDGEKIPILISAIRRFHGLDVGSGGTGDNNAI